MNFIIKFLVDGYIKSVGASFGKILGLFNSDRMIAAIVFGLAETWTKRTKNTVDDDLVAQWKAQVIEAGIDVK